MSNFITNQAITSASWTSVGVGAANFTVINDSGHRVLVAVSDTTGNIAGSVPLQPGDALPLNGVPASTNVWVKIPGTVRRAGQPGYDNATGSISVYKAAS